MTFDEALEIVYDWSTDKFTSLAENSRLKQARGQEVTPLEFVALKCKADLGAAVGMRNDASEFVFYMGSDKQRRDCPQRFEEGATPYARTLQTYTWNIGTQQFDVHPLEYWLDNNYLTTSLVLMGAAGKGKSKLSHMLAQECCIAEKKELYVLCKAMDPLGILSHAGVLKKAGALIVTDADFRTTKGQGRKNCQMLSSWAICLANLCCLPQTVVEKRVFFIKPVLISSTICEKTCRPFCQSHTQPQWHQRSAVSRGGEGPVRRR